jgi:F0F1-type ATP synthase assembly protein I
LASSWRPRAALCRPVDLAPPGPIVRYGRYGALAFEFSGTIAGGALVGWAIDGWLGSAPYALVACTLLSVVGGFIRLIIILKRFEVGDRESEP